LKWQARISKHLMRFESFNRINFGGFVVVFEDPMIL